MSVFNPEKFLKSEISLLSVSELLKPELITLAKFLKLTFDAQSRKCVIKDLILDELIEMDRLPESARDVHGNVELEKQKLHLKERELELKYQNEREEREA